MGMKKKEMQNDDYPKKEATATRGSQQAGKTRSRIDETGAIRTLKGKENAFAAGKRKALECRGRGGKAVKA